MIRSIDKKKYDVIFISSVNRDENNYFMKSILIGATDDYDEARTILNEQITRCMTDKDVEYGSYQLREYKYSYSNGDCYESFKVDKNTIKDTGIGTATDSQRW